MKTEQIVVLTAVTFLVATAVPAMAAAVLVYPKQNQTKEQQEQDTFSCYKWAKEQTGFDPTKPAAQASTQAPQSGAAGGPHRRRQAEKQQQAAQQQAAQQQAKQQQEASINGYKRAFSGCMTARGYTVS